MVMSNIVVPPFFAPFNIDGSLTPTIVNFYSPFFAAVLFFILLAQY
jgi:hypothetical protein